jgi:hypothetical protein
MEAAAQVACDYIDFNGSGEDSNSMSSRQQANAAHRCQQYNQAENAAEWIDSPNELIDRPGNERHCRKDAQRGLWRPPLDYEPSRDRPSDEDRQGDRWPLGDRDATSSEVDEHPSNARRNFEEPPSYAIASSGIIMITGPTVVTAK